MITSTANLQIKQLRKLMDKKGRQQSSLFLAEGLRIIIEAVQLEMPLRQVFYSPELLVSATGKKLVYDLIDRRVDVIEVTAQVFRSFSIKDEPQGIAAVIAQEWVDLETLKMKEGEMWVALDSVADPGNLGTILRTNDAAGGQGIILLDQSTDPYDPSAIRGSMGAVFNQKLVKSSWDQFSHWKVANGIPLIGTAGSSDSDYHQFRFPDPVIILMGSERHGLLPHHLQYCDQVVSVPMAGRSDSLNLAAATAIVLYEVVNQRRDQFMGGSS